MTNIEIIKRKKAVAAAVGSVRAEGLKPSLKTQKRLKEYAKGNITIAELRKATLEEVKNK